MTQNSASTSAIAAAVRKVFRVLIGVDPQVDFCPGGNLAVGGGHEIMDLINQLASEGTRDGKYDLKLLTKDWHPANHGSFASQHGAAPFTMGTLSGMAQMLWTDHCVQGTPGAEFHPVLDLSLFDKIFVKGTDVRVDSYSGIRDNGNAAVAALKAQYPFLGQSTGLAEHIVAMATAAGADQIEVDVVGLALDYCVAYTAKDAAGEQFKGKNWTVRVVVDACRAIGDVKAAVDDLEKSGVSCVESVDVLPLAA